MKISRGGRRFVSVVLGCVKVGATAEVWFPTVIGVAGGRQSCMFCGAGGGDWAWQAVEKDATKIAQTHPMAGQQATCLRRDETALEKIFDELISNAFLDDNDEG